MSLLVAALLAAAPSGEAVPAAPPAPAEKVRCRTYFETGSLVRKRKECHTEREWDEMSRNVQNDIGKLQGAGHKAGQ